MACLKYHITWILKPENIRIEKNFKIIESGTSE